MSETRKIAAILVSDVVGYSRLAGADEDRILARLRGLFRTIFFAPYVTTLVAVAVVFRYLYHPRFGLLNQALGVAGQRLGRRKRR